MPETLLVAARQQRRARRAAVRSAHVSAGESHAIAGQRVNLRRGNLRIPLASQLAIAKIIGHDDEDVWRPLRRSHGKRSEQKTYR